MKALTREQIETWRNEALEIKSGVLPVSAHHYAELCDMALSSLSPSQDAIHAARVEGALAALMHRYAHPDAEPSKLLRETAETIVEVKWPSTVEQKEGA